MSKKSNTNQMMTSSDVDIDYYELLGIPDSATLKEIQRAYRLAALTCHPDKVKDDPEAAERFHTLTMAVEMLGEEGSRRAYDVAREAKVARAKQLAQQGAKRRAAREELEEREQKQALASKMARHQYEVAVQKDAQIRALRQEGQDLVRNQTKSSRRNAEILGGIGRAKEEALNILSAASRGECMEDLSVKVKWDGSLSQDLESIFAAFGPIDHVMKGKKESAIILFKNVYGPIKCHLETKTTLPVGIKSIIWLSENPEKLLSAYQITRSPSAHAPTARQPALSTPSTPSSAHSHVSTHKVSVGKDYESSILERMKAMK